MAGTQASSPQSHRAWEGNEEHNLGGLIRLLISRMLAVLRASGAEGGGAAGKQKYPLLAFSGTFHEPGSVLSTLNLCILTHLILPPTLQRRDFYCPHLTDEETEAQ